MASSLQKYNGNMNLSAWSEMVRECRESELTVGEWCRANGIALSTYYSRQRKVCTAMEKSAAPAEFYEVRGSVSAEVPAATLHLGEIAADIYPAADEEMITAILRAFRSC